jgi:energy-coupling factor transporter transmembrane protein EcfT
MIDLLAIDRWSATGHSWLHRLPVGAKALAVLAIVALLVAAREPLPLALLYGLLIACLVTTRLPALPILGLSVAPVAMSAVFAVSRAGGGAEAAAVVVLKGAITSLAMLLLVTTTPHTALLRLVRRALPATLAEMLFLGYRSIFIVLGRALAARDALRLRAAPAPWHARLRRGSLVGALAVLRATELAADQYAALRLRTPNAGGLGHGVSDSGEVGQYLGLQPEAETAPSPLRGLPATPHGIGGAGSAVAAATAPASEAAA